MPSQPLSRDDYTPSNIWLGAVVCFLDDRTAMLKPPQEIRHTIGSWHIMSREANYLAGLSSHERRELEERPNDYKLPCVTLEARKGGSKQYMAQIVGTWRRTGKSRGHSRLSEYSRHGRCQQPNRSFGSNPYAQGSGTHRSQGLSQHGRRDRSNDDSSNWALYRSKRFHRGACPLRCLE